MTFQQPITTTRPAARPTQQSPARPKFMLAGRQVSQEMFYTAQAAKRDGQRCFLVTAEPSVVESVLPSAVCANCEGYGRLALEVAVGGPFEDVPAAGAQKTGS